MKKLLFLLLLIPALAKSQTTGYFRYDTIRLEKIGGNAELIIMNSTRDSAGVLYNIGKGRTKFFKPKMLNDSTLVIGLDTLSFKGGSGSGGKDTLLQTVSRTKYYADYSGSSSFTMPQVPVKIYGVEVWNIAGGVTYPYALYSQASGSATITISDPLETGDKVVFDYDYKNQISFLDDSLVTYIQFIPPLYGELDTNNTLIVRIDTSELSFDPAGSNTAIQYNKDGVMGGADSLKYNGIGFDIKHPSGLTSQLPSPIDGGFRLNDNVFANFGLRVGALASVAGGRVMVDSDGDLYYSPVQWIDSSALGLTYSRSIKVRDTVYARLGLFESNTGLTNYPLIVRNTFPNSYKTARFEGDIVQVELNTTAANLSGNVFATHVYFDKGVLKGIIGYDGNVTPSGKMAMVDVRNGADATWEINGSTYGGFYNIGGTSARYFFGAPPTYHFDYGQRVQVIGSLRVTDSIKTNRNALITNPATNYDFVMRHRGDSSYYSYPGDSIIAQIARAGGGGGGGGSGTVNGGTANTLAYYPSTGTAVDDLPAITAARALVSDANGLPVAATTTTTQLNYLSTTTSDVQTQLNAKLGYVNGIPYGTTTGGTTAFSVTTSPNFGAPAIHQVIEIRPNTTNTGASTLNVNGSGGVNLFKGTNQPLIAGDLVGARHYLAIFNGSTWQLVGEYNTIGTIGTGAANGLAISNGVITPHVATSSFPGMVSTAAQDFAGNKGFQFGSTSVTAKVHIGPGAGTAGTASLKMDQGSLLSTPEAGAVENSGRNLYWTEQAGNREIISRVSMKLVSAGTLTMDSDVGAFTHYIFTGTTSTWTLPTTKVVNEVIKIKNRGSGTITLNSGASDIWNTSATNTLAITANSAYELLWDGTYWNVF